jgi:Gas vesicle protein
LPLHLASGARNGCFTSFFRQKENEAMDRVPTTTGTTNLVDILDRVLDKGLVIAGDVRISLANVELLTIRIRLLVCSVDKAEQIGMNWWKYDPHLTMQSPVLPSIDEVTRAAAKRRAGVPGRNVGVPGRKTGVPGRRKR